jgi:hypothetical protein
MAANFKPMFWSKYCQTELKKDLILANWCDYQFEGELKLGSRLKIVGAVRPTIQKYVPGKDLEIESLGDNSQYMDITESDAFAFEVDDIDKAQAQAGYLETQFDEAKTALAEKADAFVGTIAKDANADMMSESIDISAMTSFLTPIDQAHIKLYKNNVSQKTELAADLNPEHIVGLRSELAELFTENVEFIKRGALGKYANTYLRMSNNLYNDGTDDYEMVRTKKAIAFAGQIDKVETARKEKGFADIVKGLHVYGSKLVRPKELYVIKVH